MKAMKDLPEMEQMVLQELRSRIQREFSGWTFRMTLFGSRARGDADPDSDMDVLIEIEAEQIAFAEKQRLRKVLGEVSLDFGLVIATLIADRHLLEERGDFSIFENIREEGIPV